jgi:hypothetical protein
MGKKVRERKLARLEADQLAKLAIAERKKERLSATFELLRKFVLTLTATVVVLILGFFINQHLDKILPRVIHQAEQVR